MPRPHARIARVAALALATLVAATTVATASAAPHRPPARGSGAAARSKIRWHRCERQLPASLRCGELVVPLDYRHPRAAKIRLGFNRLRAQERRRRVGSLIVNPGGPGGAGSDVVALEAAGAGLWHPALHRRFDLIGMDPRGVGLSTRVRCDPAAYNRPVSLFPRTAAQFRRLAHYAAPVGRSCRKPTGALLGHVDTLSVARDMEALRRALGDGRLNFLGLSYGAEIGTLYAERYPKRIRAMALDGILDHSIASQALFADATVPYEDTFNRFAAWCAQTADCALHERDVVALFARLVQQADQQP